MALLALPSYPAVVWRTVLAAMVYGTATLPTFFGAQGLGLVQVLAATFRNARDAIDAYVTSFYATRGYGLLAPVLAQPLFLDPITLAFVQSRMTALQALAISTQGLQVAPVASASVALVAGAPAVPDPMLLDYFAAFAAEVPPAGLTATNFALQAQAAAAAWQTLSAAAVALDVSGVAIDEINYMASASQATADVVALAPPASNADVTAAWNGMVALPSLMRFVTGDSSDPTSIASQQMAVARLVLAQYVVQAYTVGVNLLESTPAVVNLATVRVGDTLMSIAARELGDYTQWQTIAALNGLIPPYISSIPGTGVAVPGQQLYMPGTTGQTTVASPQGAQQYENMFLGTDIFYGPIGQDMLAWTGDLQTIVGNQNLAFSLGRGLQTTMGSLIYHITFGSRIPPEIGNVTTQATVGNLEAYGVSSILADPRVDRVLSIKAVVLTSWAINLSFTALPKGQPLLGQTVNGKNVPISGVQGVQS